MSEGAIAVEEEKQRHRQDDRCNSRGRHTRTLMLRHGSNNLRRPVGAASSGVGGASAQKSLGSRWDEPLIRAPAGLAGLLKRDRRQRAAGFLAPTAGGA